MTQEQVKILKSLAGKFVYLIPRDKQFNNELIYINRYTKHSSLDVMYDSYNITSNKNSYRFIIGLKAAFELIESGKVTFKQPDTTDSVEIIE